MTHPCQTRAAEALAALRRATLDGPAENDVPLVPGIYLSWDSEEADIRATVRTGPEALLHIKAETTGTPRWFSLNIDLGPGELLPDAVLALIAQTSGTAGMLDLALWSTDGGQRKETLLDQPLRAEAGTQALMHQLHTDDSAVWLHVFHTLSIRLPAGTWDLTLHDLRLTLSDPEAPVTAPTLARAT